MRQIPITQVTPGMILARNILNSSGQVLLSSGVALTEEYIRKLLLMNMDSLFIQDSVYEDIAVPEYLSYETQQRALSIISHTLGRIRQNGDFAPDPVYAVASDIVEELVSQPAVAIQMTGIAIHDDYTLAHSLNSAIYAVILARFTGFSLSQMKEVACGALLHDVGKMAIEKTIINKPGRLTSEEFRIIMKHPEMGFQSLIKKRWEISSLVSHMAWQHHERVDGSGYPRGLKGEEILPYARLLTLVDVYEAISVSRPYRKAMSLHAIHRVIKEGLGTFFDNDFGEVFLAKLAIYPPGTEVMLSTGDRALVVSAPPDDPRHPLVRLIRYPDGTCYTPPRDIDLRNYPHITIVLHA